MPDTTILTWITAEVDQALERVRDQIARSGSSPLDARALGGCPEHLHQVSGALNMVGLAGATRFCEALETTLTGLNGSRGEAAGIIDRAVAELKQFVDAVARGEPNVPLRLYPAYQALAQLQGRAECAEVELFFPDLTPPAPTHPRPKSLGEGELASFLHSQRTRWQRGILAWIKRQPAGLDEMRETLDAIHAVAHQLPERRALWWVAGGLVDALLDASEPQRLAQARALWNKFDIYIRDLAAGQRADNEPLLREVLYAIACSAPLTQRMRDIKRLYGLDALVPSAASDAQTRDRRKLCEGIAAKLQTLAQIWQSYLAGDPNSSAAFRERAAALRGSAVAFGDEPLSKLLGVMTAAAERLPQKPAEGSDFLLLEMSSAFLLAQSLIEHFEEPLADTAEQVDILSQWLAEAAAGNASAKAPEGLRPELTQHVSALQLRARVVGEILTNLHSVEQAFDAYARGHAPKDILAKVAPQLRQIHGALRVLSWEKAAVVIERCEQMIATLTPQGEDLDWIAEGLSSVGLFVRPCAQGREPREETLDLFLKRLEERPAPLPAAAAPAPSAKPLDDDLLQVFLEEAVEVLATIAASVPKCRAEPANVEELATIRRGFHTLKGSGRMVGLADLGEAAWQVERVMNQWLERQQPATDALLELATVAHGCFTDWIERLRNGETPLIDTHPISKLVARLVGDDSSVLRVRDVYLKEAAQHIATLKNECAAWTASEAAEASPEFMRAAHTLASSSSTARVEAIAQVAAGLEQWMPLAERTVEAAERQMIAAAIDKLGEMHSAVSRGESPAPAAETLAELEGLRNRLLVPARPKDKRAVRDDLDGDLLPVFLEEAHELVPQVVGDLRAWRANPQDRTAADAVKRVLHTLKGGARMAGAIRLGELTHLMESRIEYALEAGEVTPELFEELQTQLDRLSADVEKLGAPAAPAATAAAKTAESPRAPAATAVLRVNAERLDGLITDAGEAAIARSRIEAELRQTKQALADLNESIARLRTQLREVEIQADSQLQSRRSELAEHVQDFDPLEFDRYTRLQELTRMMAEGLNDVATLQQALMKNVGETDAALLQQARIGRELQQDLMRMRAVPFSNLTERLQRIVRQSAAELARKAELTIEGGQVELDRGVLERIGAPIEHMLRNALVHGIEAPATRAAAGKPEAGQIAISLRQEANEVVVMVTDDGAGIDLERLQAKAVEKGLLAADQLLSEAEQVQLVFMSGISTAESVTELAGRGVGMDVVRTEIHALGGRVEVTSARGRGTTFTIYLPLTLAVTQTVMVRAGGMMLAISSALIEQVLRVKADALVSHYETGSIEFQGRQYPLHYLRQLLGSRAATNIQDDNLVLLVRSGAHRLAVHVDDLIGQREMVVKNIGPQLSRMPGAAGATVLPDGSIVLIVNPVQLAHRGTTPMRTTVTPEFSANAARAAPLVMVVDDSLTVRKITGRLLEREGYRVLTAKDGVDALEQLKGELPAIMLVDIEMPRMDGFDLARNVRGDPRTMEIPIVIISSRTAAKHRSRAAELGVNAFLGKPYQESELLQQIAALAKQ
ncbi:MAG TPA: Hpt domain-containing protein [Burkholderiales bacterium]|nr:Hpt domain-containing protein [Burkholderiales bacterium]